MFQFTEMSNKFLLKIEVLQQMEKITLFFFRKYWNKTFWLLCLILFGMVFNICQL